MFGDSYTCTIFAFRIFSQYNNFKEVKVLLAHKTKKCILKVSSAEGLEFAIFMPYSLSKINCMQ